jgi:hypothetical protein
MSPAARRAAIVVAGVAVLVVAFLLLSGGKDDGTTSSTRSSTSTAAAPARTTSTATSAPSAAPAVPTVRVVGAKPQGGIKKLEFKKGDVVRFRVVSDTADEIHVHGYDFHKDVAKGGSVTFAFPGKIEGRFVVELESKGEQIAQLDVNP